MRKLGDILEDFEHRLFHPVVIKVFYYAGLLDLTREEINNYVRKYHKMFSKPNPQRS